MKTDPYVGNMKLVFDCKCIGYVVFVCFHDNIFDDDIFVEFPRGITGASRYYAIDDLRSSATQPISVMQTIAANYFDYAFSENAPDGALSEDILSKYRNCTEKRTVANIKQVKSTGEFIYIMNNVVYTAHFPVEWALEHESSKLGPGTSPTHCHNCNYYGSYKGVFIGYCYNCSVFDYNLSRGYGFDEGKEQDLDTVCQICPNNSSESAMFATYLKNIPLENIGYDSDAETCLSGGELPTTRDICDDQSDIDPVRLHQTDDYLEVKMNRTVQESNRYPRRAYGIPAFIRNEILRTRSLDADSIRNKLEQFFRANDMEVTDDNYSFPIGHREEWDHYRTQKHPCYWYAWNVLLKTPEKIHLQIRLYVSSPPVWDERWKIVQSVLACNTSSYVDMESNTAYSSMITHMSDWILDNTDTPVFDVKRDASNKDTSNKDTSNKDTSNKDTSNKDTSSDDYTQEPLDTDEETSDDTMELDTDEGEDQEENNTQPQAQQDDTWEIIIYCIIVYFVIVFYSH